MKYKVVTKILRKRETEQIEDFSMKPNLQHAINRTITLMPITDKIKDVCEVDGEFVVLTELGKYIYTFEEEG